MDSLVGQSLSPSLIESEAKRIVWECISINSHIAGITDFTVDMTNDILTITFTATTDQGEVSMSV